MDTWTDIELAARYDPVLQIAVLAVRAGRLTREQALIQVAVAHHEIRDRQHREILDLRNANPSPILVFKGQPVVWDRDRDTTLLWPASEKPPTP